VTNTPQFQHDDAHSLLRQGCAYTCPAEKLKCMIYIYIHTQEIAVTFPDKENNTVSDAISSACLAISVSCSEGWGGCSAVGVPVFVSPVAVGSSFLPESNNDQMQIKITTVYR
jgi:hypothetical protein